MGEGLENCDVQQTTQWLTSLGLTQDYGDTLREHNVNGAKLLEVDNVLLDEWYIHSGADRLKILQSVLDVREQMAASRRFHLGVTIEDVYKDSGMMMIRRGLDPIGEEDEEADESASSRIKAVQNARRVESVGATSLSVERREVKRDGKESVDVLAGENVTLRRKLEESERRLSRLVKFEVEMTQLHKAYETLESQGAKREKLEMAMRARLEAEVKRLRDTNQLLQAEMESQMTASSANLDEISYKLSERDQTIVTISNRLATSQAGCEQLQQQLRQCQSQLAERTVELERTQQELETARDDIETLKDDLLKKSALSERVYSLQEALASLHEATEKREALEESLRWRMEQEIKKLKKERQANWRKSAPIINPIALDMNGQSASPPEEAAAHQLWHSPNPPSSNSKASPFSHNTATDQKVSQLDLAVKSLQAVVRRKEQEVEMLEKQTVGVQEWLSPEPPLLSVIPPSPQAVGSPSLRPALHSTPNPVSRIQQQQQQLVPPQQGNSFYGSTSDGIIYEGEALEV
ncbi:shootin-1-like [Corticium candelabrum]|uniref:shootin-1-like n=1 Tax=Corticium candelabrum TaxID=121492 RepID=UPI002E259989|nr:shootin-1-like [Corticium candelabrum]